VQIEQNISVQCPFCFETINVLVDAVSGNEQSFVYDCEVCCRPIDLRVSHNGSEFEVEIARAYD